MRRENERLNKKKKLAEIIDVIEVESLTLRGKFFFCVIVITFPVKWQWLRY